VKHLLGSGDYDVRGFADRNMNSISPDVIALCKGDGKDTLLSDNLFIQALFSENMLAL
jgi:hypothetical protein